MKKKLMKIKISDLQFYYLNFNSLSNWNNAVNEISLTTSIMKEVLDRKIL